ncbi:unnamed protein product, partial [Vitis vinifera]
MVCSKQVTGRPWSAGSDIMRKWCCPIAVTEDCVCGP